MSLLQFGTGLDLSSTNAIESLIYRIYKFHIPDFFLITLRKDLIILTKME